MYHLHGWIVYSFVPYCGKIMDQWEFGRATLSGVKWRNTDHDSCWGRK
jgi:hypothetical protein